MNNATVGMQARGRVHVKKFKRDGTITHTSEFNNKVLAGGYERIIRRLTRRENVYFLYSHNMMAYLYLGTGTTEPTINDTGLENKSDTVPGVTIGANKYSPTAHDMEFDTATLTSTYKITNVFKYGEGVAEGVWTELGLADEDYTVCVTRALFRDENGQPKSLTVLSDEFLTITYDLEISYSPGPPGTFEFNGQTIGYQWLPQERATSPSRIYDATFSYPFPLFKVSTYSNGVQYPKSNYGFSYTSTDVIATVTNTVAEDGQSMTGKIVLDPGDNDVDIYGWSFSNDPEDCNHPSRSAHNTSVYYMIFDEPITKLADNRMTIEVAVTFSIYDTPVTNLAYTADTSSITLTWDAYPGATKYVIDMHRDDDYSVSETKEVTGPSVTFSGLEAGTGYSFGVMAVATPYSSARIPINASTE